MTATTAAGDGYPSACDYGRVAAQGGLPASSAQQTEARRFGHRLRLATRINSRYRATCSCHPAGPFGPSAPHPHTTPRNRPLIMTATPESLDSFKSRRTLKVGNRTYEYFSLKAAERNGLDGIGTLPFSLKVLLENLLRHEDGRTVTADHIRAM